MVKSGNKLIGEYKRRVDIKRRFFIPSELRVSRSWVITAGMEKCLFIFPEKEWDKVTDKIIKFPLTKKDTRRFLRVLLSRARLLTCDSQGRVLLPEKLVEYAGLKDSCVVIGMLNRIELWNPDKWEEYSHKSEEKYSELAENIAEQDL